MDSKRKSGQPSVSNENAAKGTVRKPWLAVSILVLTGILAVAGCCNTPIDNSDFGAGPAPLRMLSPAKDSDGCQSYEDSLTGGKVFDMYCSQCHNAPSLAERNFANFRNIATHMRVRANLTGKEYAKLMEFLQRWHDMPPPTPPVEPSPKRFYPSQPIQELRDQTPAQGGAPAPQQQPK